MEGIWKDNDAEIYADIRYRKATLVISNEEIDYVMKINTSLEDSGFLIEVNTNSTENKGTW